MANPIKLLRSTTSGAAPSSLVSGQVAINERDGVLYYRNSVAGAVTPFPGYIPDGYIYDCGVYAAIVPAAPTGLTATPGSLQAALAWTSPTNTGGVAITDYFIEFSSNAGSSWSTFSHTASTATTATVTVPSAGTYLFRVSAINSVGTGATVTSSSTSISAGSSLALTDARSQTWGGNGTVSTPYTISTTVPGTIGTTVDIGGALFTASANGNVRITGSLQSDAGITFYRSGTALANSPSGPSIPDAFGGGGGQYNGINVTIAVTTGQTIRINDTGNGNYVCSTALNVWFE